MYGRPCVVPPPPVGSSSSSSSSIELIEELTLSSSPNDDIDDSTRFDRQAVVSSPSHLSSRGVAGGL